MLSSLISNRSLEKILFFLLLNDKCYAAQLSQRFNTPLTPLQYALGKLEKGGVLLSHCQGRTRFYEFNPAYPLLNELEALLKKAYIHLPPNEKKGYYNPALHTRSQRFNRNNNRATVTSTHILQKVWQKLQGIKLLSFSAKSKSLGAQTGWNGLGKGNVDVKPQGSDILLFNERGTWVSEENQQFEFSNIFRWTLRIDQGVILLEHLRFGAQNPVFLFSLIPINEFALESLDSHVCNEDSYFGQLHSDKHFVQLNWRVIGPKKNEEIDYLYT